MLKFLLPHVQLPTSVTDGRDVWFVLVQFTQLAHVHFTVCLNTERGGSGEEAAVPFLMAAEHGQAGEIGWSCDRERRNCGLWAD